MNRAARWSLILIILIVGIALRFWDIEGFPPGFHDDESFEGLEAWRILSDPNYRPIFLTGSNGVPVLNIYANALMFQIFIFFGGEAGPVAMRVTAACFGVLGILALYALATELQKLDKLKSGLSLAYPLFAAAVLAILRWHVHFSRIGIEPILVPLLWSGAMYGLLYGWRTERWRGFVLCGVMMAAGMYAYQGAWVIPGLIMAVSIYLIGVQAVEKKESTTASYWQRLRHVLESRQVIGLALAALVAFILFVPLGWFLWDNWELTVQRPNQLVIEGKGGRTAQQRLLENVWSMSAMFGPFGDSGDDNLRRNIPDEPIFDLWLAIPFYLGLLFTLWRIRLRSFLFIWIGLVGLGLPGVFSTSAPHFHRILGMSAPTALLCAVGLDRLWQWRPGRAAKIYFVSILMLLATLATSTHNYFVRWAAYPDLYYSFDTDLWDIGQHIASLPKDSNVYMTPIYHPDPTILFAPEANGHKQPVFFDGIYAFPLTEQRSTRPEYYIVMEEDDYRTRLMLSDVFPTAQVIQEFSDWAGNIYARSYMRPAETESKRPPQRPMKYDLGDGISLLGYDVQPATLQSGEPLYLQLHWRVSSMPTESWTVFTHVLKSNGSGGFDLVAGHDSLPGNGRLPTDRWQAGWLILDEYKILLPNDLPSGEYKLEIGLYQENGKSLPQEGTGLLLGAVEIQ